MGALTGVQPTQGQAAPLGLASGAFWAPGRNQGRNLVLKTLPGLCSQGQGDSSPPFLKKRVTCLVSQRLSVPLPSPQSRVQSWGSHHPLACPWTLNSPGRASPPPWHISPVHPSRRQSNRTEFDPFSERLTASSRARLGGPPLRMCLLPAAFHAPLFHAVKEALCCLRCSIFVSFQCEK